METIIVGIVIAILVILSIVTAMPNNEESQPQDEASVSPATKQPEKLTQTTETPKYTEFPQYEYKFVDLNLVDTDIIKQIDNICKNFSTKGWDYYRLETSVIKHTPGCLGAIFGAQEYYTKHQYIVFRRPFKKNKDFLESSNIK